MLSLLFTTLPAMFGPLLGSMLRSSLLPGHRRQSSNKNIIGDDAQPEEKL
jgi:hypothetical protein